MPDAGAHGAVPRAIAGYEIVSPLRSGGMATLYLARRTGAGGFVQHFALKLVHPRLAADPELVTMFLDEARLAARLDHPACVHVTELGQDGDDYFIAMEYVPGYSLAEVLRRLSALGRRLSPAAVAHVVAEVAAGLHAAHELVGDDGYPLGVVHRDVSPQNVLLSDKGYVKVIDFGIAKARGRMLRATAEGLVKGKLAYMAPEQARGEAVDRRTDVYALGVVLWEMLTMRRRFWSRDQDAVLREVRDPVPIDPRAAGADVDDALAEVVSRALRPDPDARFATARDLARALREAVPESRSMDAVELAKLLAALMPDEAERRRETLPTVELETPKVEAAEGRALVARHTADLMPRSAPEDARTVEWRRQIRRSLVAGTVHLDWDLPEDEAAAPPRPAPAPRRSRVGGALVTAGLGLLGLGLGIGLVVAIVGVPGRPVRAPQPVPGPSPPAVAEGRPAEPVAEPLPPSAEPAPVDVAEEAEAAPASGRARRETRSPDAPPGPVEAAPADAPLITDNPFR